jgi:spore coat polysaccharide biosynthesis protein SpsF
MSTVAIIQARIGSTRLPAKVLLPLPNGQIVLRQVIKAARQIKGVDRVVVAIPDTTFDDLLIPHLRAENVAYFRGSEEDVLDRYYQAAEWAKADTVMRITADCPLLDPDVCAEVLKIYHMGEGEWDYVSNTLPRTFPKGLDCEVFGFELLAEAWEHAVYQPFREHVTLWMIESWKRPQLKLANYSHDEDYSKTNWSLDTVADYHRICEVMRKHALPQIAAMPASAAIGSSS